MNVNMITGIETSSDNVDIDTRLGEKEPRRVFKYTGSGTSLETEVAVIKYEKQIHSKKAKRNI